MQLTTHQNRHIRVSRSVYYSFVRFGPVIYCHIVIEYLVLLMLCPNIVLIQRKVSKPLFFFHLMVGTHFCPGEP